MYNKTTFETLIEQLWMAIPANADIHLKDNPNIKVEAEVVGYKPSPVGPGHYDEVSVITLTEFGKPANDVLITADIVQSVVQVRTNTYKVKFLGRELCSRTVEIVIEPYDE